MPIDFKLARNNKSVFCRNRGSDLSENIPDAEILTLEKKSIMVTILRKIRITRVIELISTTTINRCAGYTL